MINILIPCYNSEDTIVDVLDGIAEQTYKNYKIYISDNCSIDKTIEKIENHKLRKKIILLRNSRNLGLVRNVNKILHLGQEPYSALCSSNDTLYPEYLEKLLDAQYGKKNISVSYALPDFYHGESLLKRARSEEYFDTSGMGLVDRYLEVVGKFTYSAPFWSLHNKKTLSNLQLFPLYRGGDHVFVAEAALYGEIVLVKENLFKRRISPHRTMEDLAVHENDQNLQRSELSANLGWHSFPTLSMLYAHHQMLKKSFLSLSKKNQLILQTTVMLARRMGKNLASEMCNFRASKIQPNSQIGRLSYYEIKGYFDYISELIEIKNQ